MACRVTRPLPESRSPSDGCRSARHRRRGRTAPAPRPGSRPDGPRERAGPLAWVPSLPPPGRIRRWSPSCRVPHDSGRPRSWCLLRRVPRTSAMPARGSETSRPPVPGAHVSLRRPGHRMSVRSMLRGGGRFPARSLARAFRTEVDVIQAAALRLVEQANEAEGRRRLETLLADEDQRRLAAYLRRILVHGRIRRDLVEAAVAEALGRPELAGIRSGLQAARSAPRAISELTRHLVSRYPPDGVPLEARAIPRGSSDDDARLDPASLRAQETSARRRHDAPRSADQMAAALGDDLDLVRLRLEDRSIVEISAQTGLARATVADQLKRAASILAAHRLELGTPGTVRAAFRTLLSGRRRTRRSPGRGARSACASTARGAGRARRTRARS